MTACFHLLTSLREICSAFHVRRETVLRWRADGAPIVQVSDKRYLTDASQLWDWLVEMERKKMRPDASQ